MTTEGRNQRLELLHDHYKESFANIRATERSRDRRFLLVIALFGLVGLQTAYPAEFSGSVATVSLLGTDVQLGALPLAALLSATWAFTLAIALRYCQDAISVDRQYPYLHKLEGIVSEELGGNGVYLREGEEYLRDYPLILNVAWIAYVIVFPVIAIFSSVALMVVEWRLLENPWPHKVLDSVIAVSLAAIFYLYRIDPYVNNCLRRRRPPKTS